MNLVQELQARESAIIDAMVRHGKRPGVNDEDARQFCAGFFQVVLAGAMDNHKPREDFLNFVVPGVKMSGVSLAFMLESMTKIALAMFTQLSRESQSWMIGYVPDYTSRVTDAWEAG